MAYRDPCAGVPVVTTSASTSPDATGPYGAGRVCFPRQLPLTENGKIEPRRPSGTWRCRRQWRLKGLIAPATETEKAVVQIFAEVLKVLSSLTYTEGSNLVVIPFLATRVLARLRQRFKIGGSP